MRIVVDPIACDGHGQCAELLPEVIALDDWGYPIIDNGEIPAALEPLAKRAVRACPTLALRLQAAEVARPRRRNAQFLKRGDARPRLLRGARYLGRRRHT